MISIDDVESFLDEFKTKMKIWSILYRDDRGKNAQTLLDLDITPQYRTEIIANLMSKDYVEGPIPDTLYKSSDLWVFGKTIKKQEIYIKITMGIFNKPVICISFHKAYKSLSYPHS